MVVYGGGGAGDAAIAAAVTLAGATEASVLVRLGGICAAAGEAMLLMLAVLVVAFWCSADVEMVKAGFLPYSMANVKRGETEIERLREGEKRGKEGERERDA